MNNAQATYLDILRGVAAQLVLFGHIFSMVLFPGETTGLGDLGVIIFFILSGFLITYTSLLKKSRSHYSFTGYLSDRFFRIFVPYVPAVFLIVVLDSYVFLFTEAIEYLNYFNLKNLLATLTMTQQHPIGLILDKLFGLSEFKLTTFGSARPLWTVASEWWLYLVFGLVLFLKRLSSKPVLLSVVFSIALIPPFFNSVAGTGQGLSLVWFVMSGLGYLYFTSGKLVEKKILIFLKIGRRERIFFILLLGALLALILLRFIWVSYVEPGFIFERPIFYDFNFYLLVMLFFVLIFLVLGSMKMKARNKLFTFVADYSYSLYLIHYTLLFFLVSVELTTGNKLFDFAFSYLAVNFLAIIFWWLFERNYKRVKVGMTQLLLREK